VADQAHIRNFSIIAHIDHGKSTLADRILETTHTVDPRSMKAQLLDSMDLERERGITIKAQAVRVFYEAADGETYQLHLIDTPGHVDFTYEVSRSLAACEGALLLVDASQGVEAQTVANTYLAVDSGLELIPAMNKVDLPGAEPERVGEEIADLIGEDPNEVKRISAKTGEGVDELLEEIVRRVPPPHGDPDAPPRALIFDSEYDQYRGVIAYIRVVDGTFTKGETIRAMANRHRGRDRRHRLLHARPAARRAALRGRGRLPDHRHQGRHEPRRRRHADHQAQGAPRPLPGYRDVKPMVFCGLFPMNNDDYPELRDALEKLTLNDAALSWEPETSDALGFGFRCGFLGLLHMDIVRERLEREYDLELMATMPSVEFEVTLTDGSVIPVHNPTDMPDPARSPRSASPTSAPRSSRRRSTSGRSWSSARSAAARTRACTTSAPSASAHLRPAAGEIVLDFFDQLKTRTKGYASLDYEPIGLRPSNLVKLDVLLGGDPVDALSMVVHRDKAYDQGKVLTERLRKKIPRQQYDVPIQAAVGREDHRPRDGQGLPQGRHGQVLRRRHLPQAQAAREAEGGQAPDEAGRPRRGAAGGVPGRARAGRRRVSHSRTYASGARRCASTRTRRGVRPALPRPEAARAAGYDDIVAPPMFAAVYSWRAMAPVVLDPEVGIDFSRMVHGGQEFTWHAPVVAGDEITTEAEFTDRPSAATSTSSPSPRARSTSAANSSARGHGRTS
jgi:GTP-binding protein LepA